MHMPIQSTSGQVIKDMPRQTVTLYAPDGTPHVCAPIDAREILASGAGYTETPPVKPREVIVEQQSEQQSIAGDAASAETGDSGSDAETGDGGDESNAPRRPGRPRKI